MKFHPKNMCIFFVVIIVLCLHFTLNLNAKSPKEGKVLREKFVQEAMSHLGTPYKYGGYEADGFDCSGLIFYSSRESIKVQLPRTASAIHRFVKEIKLEDCQKGDLLFFKTTTSGKISHVGIYLGNAEFISSISDGTKTGVVISSMNHSYWKEKFYSAGRFLPEIKSEESL